MLRGLSGARNCLRRLETFSTDEESDPKTVKTILDALAQAITTIRKTRGLDENGGGFSGMSIKKMKAEFVSIATTF
jgi:hypothetical protein